MVIHSGMRKFDKHERSPLRPHMNSFQRGVSRQINEEQLALPRSKAVSGTMPCST